jgi:hypothetical protein
MKFILTVITLPENNGAKLLKIPQKIRDAKHPKSSGGHPAAARAGQKRKINNYEIQT